VADKPDGKQRNERITFTRPAAERIAKVVRHVEGGNRDSSGLTFRRVPPQAQGGGSEVRLAIYTATSSWIPISPFTTSATNQFNIKTIQFVYPTATAVVGSATVGVPNGPTAQCINNMAFLPGITTVVTASITIVTVMKEAGSWRLIGVSR
jgi:small ligand-binding sensory domain FIST